MTSNKRRKIRLPVSEVIIILSLTAMLTLNAPLSKGASFGLILCAGTIIPSVFPFMVLAELISCTLSRRGLGILSYPLSRLGLSKSDGAIAVTGTLCGFPSSARGAANAYRMGEISERRAITVSALSSTPSPPFILGAIGAGLLNDEKAGILIFISLILSVIILSSLLLRKDKKAQTVNTSPSYAFNFTAAVNSAGRASITVFSFVCFFSAICEVIKHFVSDTLFPFLSVFIEISTSLVSITQQAHVSPLTQHALIGFSVGFGGLCANLQCASFLSELGIKTGKFHLIKLALGVICSAVTSILFLIFKI